MNFPELHRELGRVEEASIPINQVPEIELGTTSYLISDLSP
jgi:hypothetical protein